MLDALYSISKYLSDTLAVAPYSFAGEVKIDHANYIDLKGNKPKILINDIYWDWDNEQFGSFSIQRISPLNIEVVAGDKIYALKMSDWLVGKRGRGEKGLLLSESIPYCLFDSTGNTVVETVGVIKFGNNPLPTVRFNPIINTSEQAYIYVLEFFDVACIFD